MPTGSEKDNGYVTLGQIVHILNSMIIVQLTGTEKHSGWKVLITTSPSGQNLFTAGI